MARDRSGFACAERILGRARKMVGLGVGGKGAAANVIAIGVNGLRDEFACVAITTHKFGRQIKCEAGEIVEDQDLAIALRTSANADGRAWQLRD